MAGSGLGLARVCYGTDSGVTRPWQGFHPDSIKGRPGLDPGETQVRDDREATKRRRCQAGTVLK